MEYAAEESIMDTRGIALVNFNPTNKYFVLPARIESAIPADASVPNLFELFLFSLLSVDMNRICGRFVRTAR